MKNSMLPSALILSALTAAVLARPCAAQGLAGISGSWTGDKALGTVALREHGSGKLTFESDSTLSMEVRARIAGNEVLVEQAEPNRAAFYLAFNPYLKTKLSMDEALELEREARPMSWSFRLAGKAATPVPDAPPGRLAAGFRREKEGWLVEVVSTRREGDDIHVGLMVTNKAEERRELILRAREISPWTSESRIVDAAGLELAAKSVVVGAQSGDLAGRAAAAPLYLDFDAGLFEFAGIPLPYRK